MKYNAELLNEDKVIQLEKDDVYLRLNVCTDVVFNNSKITVSSNTSACFFLAGSTFHIYRSGLLRKRSGGFSNNGSRMPSPKGTFNNFSDPASKPSATPFIDSGAFSETVAVVAQPTPIVNRTGRTPAKSAIGTITKAVTAVTTAAVNTTSAIAKSVADTGAKIVTATVDTTVKTTDVPKSNHVRGLGRRAAAVSAQLSTGSTVAKKMTDIAASVITSIITNAVAPPHIPYSNMSSIEFHA